MELLRATPGSTGLDLSSAIATILTPDVLVASIPTGVAGLLPEGIVGLVLGCGLLSFQGISVVSDVVNSDYTWEIKVLISSPAKTVQINKGQRINSTAFAFTLLSDRKKKKTKTKAKTTLTSQARGPRGFGSSDLALGCWKSQLLGL